MNYASLVSRRSLPQTQPLVGRNQVQNSAGGYVFKIDPFKQLERFLILGSEKGTYYASERNLTIENSLVLEQCLAADYVRTIDLITTISKEGRAPKNDPAIFALSQAAGSKDSKVSSYALSKLNEVCRIGTHLFQFVDSVQHFRGWGRGLRNAVAGWYNGKSDSSLAYQVAKYRNRSGWTHNDVLRKCHAVPNSASKAELFSWVVGKKETSFEHNANMIVAALESLNGTSDVRHVKRMIEQYKLTWEMVPTQFLGDPDVWATLLPNTKLNALIRNLGRLTSNGCLKPLSAMTDYTIERLTSESAIKAERLHPLSILVAAKQYHMGHGLKGSLSWQPIPQILNALDGAFQSSFSLTEPTGKRLMIGVDVSGSMNSGIAGMPISCHDAAACMTLLWAKTEPRTYIHAFSGRFQSLPITASDNLNSVIRKTSGLDFNTTDCSLPMVYAIENNLNVDAFIVLTDNETYAGRIHPCQALETYRRKTGIPAKLIVVGMTSTGFSIADPNDPATLDVVGFDTSVPEVVRSHLLS